MSPPVRVGVLFLGLDSPPFLIKSWTSLRVAQEQKLQEKRRQIMALKQQLQEGN
jgi:hypothetical protein